MADAFFYHLTRSTLDQTLPMLLGRALQAGWRVLVRGTDTDRIARLDARLWLGPEDGFLPHGIAGGPHDAEQPVLLTSGTDPAEDRACLMAIDGAPLGIEDCADLARVCVIFDGGDDAVLARAREQWRALTGAGMVASYWSDETGGWQLKARQGGDQPDRGRPDPRG